MRMRARGRWRSQRLASQARHDLEVFVKMNFNQLKSLPGRPTAMWISDSAATDVLGDRSTASE
jgi:hypothetical protein